MLNISRKYKNKTAVIYTALFFVFLAVPFIVLNFSHATLDELKLETADPSYIRKAKEEDDFPPVYRIIRDSAGFEITELADIDDGKNFIDGSNGSYFVVGGDDIWLFEFDSAQTAKKISKGFFSHGYKFRQPGTGKESTLLFRTEPTFFLNDKSVVIHTGDSEEVAEMLNNVVGGKFAPED